MIFKEYKPGDRLKVPNKHSITLDENKEPKERMEEVEVIRQYPNHVMVKNRKGMRWCVTNGELYAMECERVREAAKKRTETGKPKKSRKAVSYE